MCMCGNVCNRGICSAPPSASHGTGGPPSHGVPLLSSYVVPGPKPSPDRSRWHSMECFQLDVLPQPATYLQATSPRTCASACSRRGSSAVLLLHWEAPEECVIPAARADAEEQQWLHGGFLGLCRELGLQADHFSWSRRTGCCDPCSILVPVLWTGTVWQMKCFGCSGCRGSPGSVAWTVVSSCREAWYPGPCPCLCPCHPLLCSSTPQQGNADNPSLLPAHPSDCLAALSLLWYTWLGKVFETLLTMRQHFQSLRPTAAHWRSGELFSPLERWKGWDLERESNLSAAVLKTENELLSSISRMESSPVISTSGLFCSASLRFKEGLFACICVMLWQRLWSADNPALTFLAQTPLLVLLLFLPCLCQPTSNQALV